MRDERFQIDYVYGILPTEELVATLGVEETVNFELEYSIGNKQYELSNHLGNVLSVISDIKTPVASGTVVAYYESVVISSQDYSPFGVTLEGRSWSAGYRYGFNGKEKDSEGMGGGNQTYDYGFRIYNPSLGKFLSVDPLSAKYGMLTPYQFASNRPIDGNDIDGLEWNGMVTNNMDPLDGDGDGIHSEQELANGWKISKMLLASVGCALLGPQVMIPLLLTEITGAPVTPAPQAWSSVGTNAMSEIGIAEGEAATFSAESVAETSAMEANASIHFSSRALGEMGEEALAAQYATIKPVGKGSSLPTTIGARKPDGIPGGTTIKTADDLFEAKVGFKTFRGDIVNQVAKDAELLATGQVKNITWVFYRNPNNGKVGGSDEWFDPLLFGQFRGLLI